MTFCRTRVSTNRQVTHRKYDTLIEQGVRPERIYEKSRGETAAAPSSLRSSAVGTWRFIPGCLD